MVDPYGQRVREVVNAESTKKETKETLYRIIDAGLQTLQTNRALLQTEYEQLVHASRDPAQNSPDFFARNAARMEHLAKVLAQH